MKALLIIVFVSKHLSHPPAISMQEFESMSQCERVAEMTVKILDKEHSLDTRLTETIRCVKI